MEGIAIAAEKPTLMLMLNDALNFNLVAISPAVIISALLLSLQTVLGITVLLQAHSKGYFAGLTFQRFEG